MATSGMIRQTKATWEDLDRAWPQIDTLGILSTALPASTEWYNLTFLIPHEPLRFNMLFMERAVQPQYFQPTRAWKVERFFDWYDRVFDQPVHHHHDAEDSIVFPFLHNNPSIKLPARLEEDHAVLLTNMNNVKALRTSFQAALMANDNTKLEQLASDLRSKVSELCSQMLNHLAAEEEIIVPLLREHVSKKEMDAIVEKVIKSTGTAVFMLGAEAAKGQYRSGGEAARQMFLAEIPRPLVWHHNNYANTWVDGENVAVIQSLCFDTEQPPLLPKRKGFWYFHYYSDDDIQHYYNMPFKRATQ